MPPADMSRPRRHLCVVNANPRDHDHAKCHQSCRETYLHPFPPTSTSSPPSTAPPRGPFPVIGQIPLEPAPALQRSNAVRRPRAPIKPHASRAYGMPQVAAQLYDASGRPYAPRVHKVAPGHLSSFTDAFDGPDGASLRRSKEHPNFYIDATGDYAAIPAHVKSSLVRAQKANRASSASGETRYGRLKGPKPLPPSSLVKLNIQQTPRAPRAQSTTQLDPPLRSPLIIPKTPLAAYGLGRSMSDAMKSVTGGRSESDGDDDDSTGQTHHQAQSDFQIPRKPLRHRK